MEYDDSAELVWLTGYIEFRVNRMTPHSLLDFSM